MRRISYKKILVIMILALLIFSISTISFASLINMNPNPTGPGTTQIKGIANIILGIIQLIAVAVAVIMLVVLAIKYIAASPGEKADVKKSLTVYIVGALILFAGAGLLNVIQKLATDINRVTVSGRGVSTSSGTWV